MTLFLLSMHKVVYTLSPKLLSRETEANLFFNEVLELHQGDLEEDEFPIGLKGDDASFAQSHSE